MLDAAAAYTGYTSYSYLEAGSDYREFRLVPELGRVPGYTGITLDGGQTERVRRLLTDHVVISLHDHPTVFPQDMAQVVDYNRTARQHTGYAGLARSGLTAVFDNFMDGTSCVTSQMGWKWTDVIADLGMRLSDVDHQDYLIVARRLPDIDRAHQTGRVALVVGTEAATMIENEVDRIEDRKSVV